MSWFAFAFDADFLSFFVSFVELSGALVLIELMILSLVYLYAFGIVKIKPSTAPGFDNAKNAAGENINWKTFCCALWSFHDVLGTHGIKSETKQPLAGAGAKSDAV